MAKLDLIIIDDQEEHDNIMDFLEKEFDETLYPGDERKIFAEVMTKYFVQFLERVNEKANQRFAKYAKGLILDAHGANEDCERLPKVKATDIERFNISIPLTFNVVIPKGTKVTADKEKYFQTKEVAVIMAGDTYVDVEIEALEGGADFNGYAVGSLKNLVDLVEYVSSVTNLNGTSGGDDGEPYPEEDGGVGDAHYYERIKLAKASKSTAGAEDTYIYYAKSADPTISDVKVVSPSANKVVLLVCCKDGTIPTEDILKKVLAKCSAKEVRALNDEVSAKGVTQVPYDIELCYYTSEDEETATVNEVEGKGGSIERYNAWQSAENGRAINPDRIRSEILKSDKKPVGADYVEIIKPTYKILTEEQVAKWSGKATITHKTTSPEMSE